MDSRSRDWQVLHFVYDKVLFVLVINTDLDTEGHIASLINLLFATIDSNLILTVHLDVEPLWKLVDSWIIH